MFETVKSRVNKTLTVETHAPIPSDFRDIQSPKYASQPHYRIPHIQHGLNQYVDLRSHLIRVLHHHMGTNFLLSNTKRIWSWDL